MIEMTRGNDSRITLSASKEIINKPNTLFYSHQHVEDVEQVKDAKFTKNFINRIGGKFILVDYTNTEDFCTTDEYEQIKSIALHNHYHEHLWRAIPAYFKMLPKNYLSIRSWGVEIIRSDYYGLMPNKATASDIVKYGDYAKYTDNRCVMDLFDKFFHEFEFNKIYNFLSQHIFYWERRMGLWGSSCIIKNDINFDTFVPFNVRKFFE